MPDQVNPAASEVETTAANEADEQDRRNAANGTGGCQGPQMPPRQTVILQEKKRMPGWAKGLIVLGVIILCVVLLTAGCHSFTDGLLGDLSGTPDNTVTTDFGYSYIGTLHIEGEIDEAGVGTYNHEYLLNAIDAMIEDDDNKGIILYVNTPGGSVFASDELYFKIKEYQETTGRPVYSSMQSQATSGGYYISAPCDKILANRNCWTGSIGVTMGSLINVSQLLEDLGVEVNTITSGPNKAMGSSVEPLTKEQKAIMQSLIDEAYDQFVEIVADGRGMNEKKVRRIADGRIYSAQQALDNGLIDGIATYEEAIADMQKAYDLGDCAVEEFIPESSSDLYDLLGLLTDEKNLSGITEAEAVEKLMALNGKVKVSYICEMRK